MLHLHCTFFKPILMYVSFVAVSDSMVSQRLLWRDHLTLFLQVGDAGDPVRLDALTISAGGVEESDRHVHNPTLPQYGKEPLFHSREDHWQLTRTPFCPPWRKKRRTAFCQRQNRVNDACSGIHELFIKWNLKPWRVLHNVLITINTYNDNWKNWV